MSRDPIDRFEDRWLAWARRPPRTAAGDAARKVLARLEPPRRVPAYRWLAAAAVALLAAGLWLSWPPVPAPEVAFGLDQGPPLGEGVALIWLDPETPLYMTLTPPRAGNVRAKKGDST